MLRRIGVMISVGLADSLNPSTVGPALYLATGRKRIWRVAQFTIGLFGVNLAAGVVLTIGPGRFLIGLVPHPRGTLRHVIEVVAGVVLLGVVRWGARGAMASEGRNVGTASLASRGRRPAALRRQRLDCARRCGPCQGLLMMSPRAATCSWARKPRKDRRRQQPPMPLPQAS